MPTTLYLAAYSKAYPAITNRLRASIYLQSDPQALIASIIDSIPAHPARIWNFPGLPRNNYGFTLDEINVSDVVVRNLASFAVVPGQLDGQLVRGDEQIQVGTTIGFDTGANNATFDGTSGAPDYIGWEIVPSELTGRGILVRGVDYSWDKTTGVFVLLQSGDILAVDQWYNIHFDPIAQPAGNSYPTVTDFQIFLETADITLDDTYFGNKLICEPAGDYMEVTFPNISTIPQGRRMMVEIGQDIDVRCVKFIPQGSTVINWLRGNIYAMSGDSFSVYAYSRAGVKEWRVCEADGNFKNVGQLSSEDFDFSDVINKILLDGSRYNKFKLARLYNEFVLNLDPSQVVNFDDWTTGNNRYFYSLANSSDPDNLDKFFVPDRTGLFERNNATGKAGDYADDTLKSHDHSVITGGNGSSANPGKSLIRQSYNGDAAQLGASSLGHYIQATGDSETAPKNYLINKFVII